MTCYWPWIRNAALAALAVSVLWHKTVLHVLSVVGMAVGSVLVIAVTALIVVMLNRVARTVQRRRAGAGACTACTNKCQLAITAAPAPRRGLSLTPVASPRSRATATSGAPPPEFGRGSVTAGGPQHAVPSHEELVLAGARQHAGPGHSEHALAGDRDHEQAVAARSEHVATGGREDADGWADAMAGGWEDADGLADAVAEGWEDAVAGHREPAMAGRP